MGVIALELALMRMLSLRFWSHFAYMVISVAILGFGSSGTAMILLRRWIVPAKRTWMFGAALALAVSVPAIFLAARALPLDVQFLAWDLSQVGRIAVLELLLFVPFFLGGAFVGIALMDSPGRIGGHYAANLVGSGAGAIAAVAGMYVLSTPALGLTSGAAAFCAGLILLPRRRIAIVAAIVSGAALAALTPSALRPVEMSQYKMLPQVLAMPGTKTIYQTAGPLGRIDVVSGPAIHFAPGLSLQYMDPIPPHVLLIVDGDQTSPVYDVTRRAEWAFTDHTTAAVAYHLSTSPSVCILGAGGGADIGLALYHKASSVVALEMNRQIIDAFSARSGPLRGIGGDIYHRPGVTVLPREAREFLAGADESFDVIQLPPIDAFGASGAGLFAAQESYLYTTEALSAMWGRLSPRGLLAITRWARTPPRDGLKVFETAAEMLRHHGKDPAAHLAMIRSWATVTVLVSTRPLTPQDTQRIRGFCDSRSFDLCYLPELSEEEVNRFHILDRPAYYEGAHALLGPEREAYLNDYLFEIAAATDDRPYFFHFFRWRAMRVLREQLGRRARAFVEVGYLMLLAALLQAIVLAALMLVCPLVPGIRLLRKVRGRAVVLGYFVMIGVGFMLLEMSFLQRLIRYLGHPIYSAGVVISSFMIFAGAGSYVSRYWPLRLSRLGAAAGAAVAVGGVVYLLGMERWLSLTLTAPMSARFAVAALTIAPLAFAMGHMLPTGMRALQIPARGDLETSPLVPWAWAVNGFASVTATVATPLLAMNFGFTKVTLIAAGCYLAAAGFSLLLPEAGQ